MYSRPFRMGKCRKVAAGWGKEETRKGVRQDMGIQEEKAVRGRMLPK